MLKADDFTSFGLVRRTPDFVKGPATTLGLSDHLRAPAPMAPEDLRSYPNFGQPATKLPRAARAPSTPELRSAAALALSADPVFDEGTYQRIKETLLSYAAIQVRGGWPAIPADSKPAPGANGPEVALLRKRLVISDDLAPELEAGDSYDAALVDAVKHFQLRHGIEANGSIGPQTLRALNVPVAARIKQLEASLNACSAWISCLPNATWS